MDNRAMIQRSLDCIEENLQTEITAQELAQLAHLSLFHYYRLFRQATGLPVMQYILRRRLLHLALSKIEDCVSEADLLSTVRDWALPGAKAAMDLPEGFCTEFLDTFSALYPQLPRQIIHRDPNPGNIICAEDQWGFIDFELSERNVRIYDPCYAATAVLSETFGANNESWLGIYRDILWGYDSVAKLTEAERGAIPYVILANQFVCVAWFSEQDKYAEIFETNKRMTAWLIEKLGELKNI